MPLEVPKSPTIRTTVYDNLKGVDFTNDSTNIWHRRSPDAVNMLPDESGRPFKRTGWEVAVSAEELAGALGLESVEILKCHYFELAGADHVIIFTVGGVFAYRQEQVTQGGELVWTDVWQLLEGSTDEDCYSSFDRAFFFEGNGRAAFYIYGNHKVWVYGYEDGEYTFEQATDGFEAGEITIPRLIIGADASGVGTTLQSYNILGNRACVDYSTNDLFYAYSTGDFAVDADRTAFNTKMSLSANPNKIYTFKYESSQWNLYIDSSSTPSATNQTLSQYGVTIHGAASNNDRIVILYIYGVVIPNNVSQQQLNDVKVYTTVLTQFDNALITSPNSSTPDDTHCVLITDEESKPDGNRKAWIRMASLMNTSSQEDIIRVVFPTKKIDITNYLINDPRCKYSGTATINRR